MTAWTRRTTRGKGIAFVGEWNLSARKVDEDADAQRFVEDEVAEESPARIGTCFGVWAMSVVCGLRGEDVRDLELHDDDAEGVEVGGN